jgi:hypothetical protein
VTSAKHQRSARRCAGARFPRTQIITPFNIYFNAKLIWQKHEFWRLLTNFFYFGNLGECFAGRQAGRQAGDWAVRKMAANIFHASSALSALP